MRREAMFAPQVHAVEVLPFGGTVRSVLFPMGLFPWNGLAPEVNIALFFYKLVFRARRTNGVILAR